MYANRARAFNNICRPHFFRYDASKARKYVANSAVFCRPFSRSENVSVSDKQKKGYLDIYQAVKPSELNFLLSYGINEETLAKENRVSSSISAKEVAKFSADVIKKLKRKDLQKICKAIGVNQASKNAVLVENILHHMAEYHLNELVFHPFCNPSKPSILEGFDLLSFKIPADSTKEHGRLYLGKFPSVTTVLGDTKSQEDVRTLDNWEKSEIKRQGEDKFKDSVNKTLDNGKILHETVANWLTEVHAIQKNEKEVCQNELGLLQTSETQQKFRADFFEDKLNDLKQSKSNQLLFKQIKSLKHVLIDIEAIAAVESGVVSSELGFAGTVDCIAIYKGELCVIDWKTSKKKKRSLKSCYDYPVQLSAYAGAVNRDVAYPFGVETAAIVFAYEDGSPADIHLLSCNQCEVYWDQWQSRLHLFKSLSDNSSLNTADVETITADAELIFPDKELKNADTEAANNEGFKEGGISASQKADAKHLSQDKECFDDIFSGKKVISAESNHDDIDLRFQESSDVDSFETKPFEQDFNESRKQIEEVPPADIEICSRAESISDNILFTTTYSEISAGQEKEGSTLDKDLGHGLRKNSISDFTSGGDITLDTMATGSQSLRNLSSSENQTISISEWSNSIAIQDIHKSDALSNTEVKDNVTSKPEINNNARPNPEMKDNVIVTSNQQVNDSVTSNKEMNVFVTSNLEMNDNVTLNTDTNEYIISKPELNDFVTSIPEMNSNVTSNTEMKSEMLYIGVVDSRKEREQEIEEKQGERIDSRLAEKSMDILDSNSIAIDSVDRNQAINSTLREELKPNMASLKPEYPKPVPKAPKLDSADVPQIANSYLKQKVESVKKYIFGLWS